MSSPPPPHFVLVPFLGQGHTIPMVDLACLLAEQGARVSLVVTPLNPVQLEGRARRADELAIDIVDLPFPAAAFQVLASAGGGISSIMDNFLLLLEALRLLAGPMEAFLRSLARLPSCIIADSCNMWMAGVARSVEVPWILFTGPSCFYSLCIVNVATRGLVLLQQEEGEGEGDSYTVPGMPVRVEVSKAICSKAFFTGMPGWDNFAKSVKEAMSTADGAVMNTVMEMEQQFVTCYEAALGNKPVWAVGPLCLGNQRQPSMAAGSSMEMEWLGTMEPGSVTYVCFGSLTVIPPKQLYQLGHGLEDSGKPFLWVVKAAEAEAEWLQALEARTAGRGLVVRGWAPQLAILAHPAVGGFVTHCGWNSMLESLAHGVPVVTWPHYADEFLNERLAVEVLGVGVPLAAADGAAVVVLRGDVARAVSELMGPGQAAQERRRKAKEYGEKARIAKEEGGSSYQNVTNLVQCFTDKTSTGGKEN